jgi:DNA repair exonuclease SbcCD nuclease subunit
MILASDIHIQSGQPVSRSDDYQDSQFITLDFLFRAMAEDDGIGIIGGDFFDVPRPPIALMRMVVELIFKYKIKLYVVPGQHDMPFHSMKYINSSGLGMLEVSNALTILNGPHEAECGFLWGIPYGADALTQLQLDHIEKSSHANRPHVLVWHTMVLKDQDPLYPGQEAPLAGKLLRTTNHAFDLILTGDNHQQFVISAENEYHLVNPGSMMRMTAAQVDHQPAIYSWKPGIVPIRIPLPPEASGVLDRTHIDTKKEKEERVSSFVERLDTHQEVGLSFSDNLEKSILSNPPDPLELEKIRLAVDGG